MRPPIVETRLPAIAIRPEVEDGRVAAALKPGDTWVATATERYKNASCSGPERLLIVTL